MKIIFKTLKIHNFMSFSDEVFNFEDYKGMTRIKGKNLDIPNQLNGSGKTNISSSLVYGLFGQVPAKLKIDNIYNRYLKDKNVRVEVEVSISKKDYKICSGIKNRQSYCELYEKNSDGIYSSITRSTISETRKFIENDILHCDMNLFMRTIYLNSDINYNFYNLKVSDKKDFIDKLFDISIFGEMFNIIHKDVIKLEKDIMAHQNRMIVLNKNADDYERKGKEFNQNNILKIKNITEKLNDTRIMLDDKKKLSINKNTEIEIKYTSAISKIEEDINKYESNKKIILKDKDIINHNIKLFTTAIIDRQKILDKHSDLKAKLCDECKPILSKHYNLDKYQKDIESLNIKINTEKLKDKQVNDKIVFYDDKITAYKNKLLKLNAKLSEINDEYNKEQNEIKKLELCLNSYETQLSNIKSQSNPYNDLQIENTKNIEEENKFLTELKETYKYIKKSQDIVDQENLKKFIIHDLIGLLNTKIKFYLHKLGANYDIVFDDDMNYDFITPVKNGIEYNNFSKGEQARISIATCFAFREFLSTRSRITSNILILDEFFDSGVDPLAIDNIIEILKIFVKNSKQNIFVVSHRLEVNDDLFNNIIQVEKKNNISYIRKIS